MAEPLTINGDADNEEAGTEKGGLDRGGGGQKGSGKYRRVRGVNGTSGTAQAGAAFAQRRGWGLTELPYAGRDRARVLGVM